MSVSNGSFTEAAHGWRPAPLSAGLPSNGSGVVSHSDTLSPAAVKPLVQHHRQHPATCFSGRKAPAYTEPLCRLTRLRWCMDSMRDTSLSTSCSVLLLWGMTLTATSRPDQWALQWHGPETVMSLASRPSIVLGVLE